MGRATHTKMRLNTKEKEKQQMEGATPTKMGLDLAHAVCKHMGNQHIDKADSSPWAKGPAVPRVRRAQIKPGMRATFPSHSHRGCRGFTMHRSNPECA